MSAIDCPHCKAPHIISTKSPKDVVVVLQCPACHELVVVFRSKAIALNRRIVEQGTTEERKAHMAEVIVEFLEASDLLHMINGTLSQNPVPDEDSPEGESVRESLSPESLMEAAARRPGPITSDEMRRFLEIELQCIDDPSYFRKHFG